MKTNHELAVELAEFLPEILRLYYPRPDSPHKRPLILFSSENEELTDTEYEWLASQVEKKLVDKQPHLYLNQLRQDVGFLNHSYSDLLYAPFEHRATALLKVLKG